MNRRVLLISQRNLPVGDVVDLIEAMDDFRWTKSIWPMSSGHWPPTNSERVIVAVTAEPSDEAVAFLHQLGELSRNIPLLALVHGGCREAVLELAATAADDFLLGPVHLGEFRHRMRRLVGSHVHLGDIASRLIAEIAPTKLIGRAPAFLRVMDSLPKFSASGLPVLITGETGTGKDVCARVIHQLSARRAHPFVTADCSVIPPHLFENEVFGHARGAYTDAGQEQKGLVALANGGTLFLDEIDTLSPAAQAKLLRFLQERTYRPLGSERTMHADLNLIAATNADLEAAVSEQRFRADLYFRLNILHVELPPLRDRTDDIPSLAQHFLDMLPEQDGLRKKRLSAASLQKLAAHPWPGNIRELSNVVQRAAVLSDGQTILPHHLSVGHSAVMHDAVGGTFREERVRAIEEFERGFVVELLRQNRGNVSRAARSAGKDRRAFGRLIKKYRIDRDSFNAAHSTLAAC